VPTFRGNRRRVTIGLVTQEGYVQPLDFPRARAQQRIVFDNLPKLLARSQDDGHIEPEALGDSARAGGGPTLVEGYTYRIGPHTTSDDPRRYRSEAEVERWRALDPLLRLERYLQNRGLLGAEEVREIREKCLARAQAEFEQAERLKDPSLEDTYRFMFRELPPPLKRQLARRRA
jgi:hypothetical protein